MASTSSQSPPPPQPTTATTASADPSLPSPQSASFEPSDHAKAYLVNDPQRTGFDPQTSWWMNYFRILSGQMTKEGMHHYREWRYREHEARDCAACERHRDYLFRYSPIIRFMAEKVDALNGKLDASNVLCRRCPGIITEDGTVVRKGGGFDPNYGILICANEVRNRKHLEDTLAHEMVHAYDHLRWKVDYSGKNLRHAACMEIRASMLSGECRWTREAITRGHWTLTQQFQNCVRMRAIQSVMARPHCKDDVQATKVVNEVWDSCFADTRPFDEVYK